MRRTQVLSLVRAIKVTASYQGNWFKRTVNAASEPRLEYLPIPAPMMLAMPLGSSGKFSVSQDKKSFSVKLGGWTWTYTPSLAAK